MYQNNNNLRTNKNTKRLIIIMAKKFLSVPMVGICTLVLIITMCNVMHGANARFPLCCFYSARCCKREIQPMTNEIGTESVPQCCFHDPECCQREAIAKGLVPTNWKSGRLLN